MADAEQAAESETEGGSARSPVTLSQFVARVLDQLSVSAWLPSAALVLLVAFVVQLGAVLDSQQAPDDPVEAVGRAFRAMGDTTVGEALMLAAAVIVLTMVTQAFALQSIQLLEGYWGTNRALEWVARQRCNHFRRVRRKLNKRYKKLTKMAVNRAIGKIERMQQKAVARGGAVDFTPPMLAVLRATALEKDTAIDLNEQEAVRVKDTRWTDYAPGDLQRRRVNVKNRLLDFPEPRRILPTRLGNVLRKYEDDTEQDEIQSLVQRVYDSLPVTLQVEHDELRTRLELYCSMVIVVGVVSLFAAARLAGDGWYSRGAVVVGVTGMWVSYRAAVATARAYGKALVRISQYATD